MTGFNRYCYDKVVRDATIVPTWSQDYTPGYPASDISNIWTDYTYQSKHGSNSGGGWWYITTSEQKIYYNDGSARTANITASTSYDGDSLATEIGTQMTASGGQTYTCTYSQSTKKFTISASSTFTLNCTNTTNAVWTHIGYDTAADKSGSNAYISDDIRIHNYVAVELQNNGGVAIASTWCGLVGLNVSSTYQIFKLQRWTGSAWADVGNFSYDDVNGRAIIFYTSVTPTKSRVLIRDWENADGYIEIGSALQGDYKEISVRYKYGFNEDIDDTTQHSYSKKGYVNAVIGFFVESTGVTYEVMATDEAKLMDLYRTIGKRYPFVFVQDSDDILDTMSYNIMTAKATRRGQDAYTKEITFAWVDVK